MVPDDFKTMETGGRVVGTVGGFVFATMGLLVLVFLWGGLPDDGMGGPPVFFKLFGSLIASVFVTMGSVIAVTSIKGGSAFRRMNQQNMQNVGTIREMVEQAAANNAAPASGPLSYACSHCGAPLPDHADVSPLGDVKCPFCKSWFNIHQKA